eukprot:CAMPEP_0175376296 /NCGR_PEP_ID=MMETSP0095-20121207/24204_1 /TAXON_ID=311494 /ORGANISM="Alexandrium monilatum, Strain CCMP3105" /LENGTH=35 /DNA_ID= /DNA_START= /DNA_END= /DNA_ORIENTATION=
MAWLRHAGAPQPARLSPTSATASAAAACRPSWPPA